MKTLRKGSRGIEVKRLQKLLGITVDAIFLNQTEKKVKQFQKYAGLVADGIVGEITWRALEAFSKPASVDDSLKIIRKPISVNLTRRAYPPKFLVIHFTAGSHSRQGKALACYNVFTNGKASADYAVDDVDMVQLNPDPSSFYCWAVGGKSYGNKGGRLYGKAYNANCISIEVCSTCVPSSQQAVNTDNHRGWSFTPAVLDNAVKLAKHLMKLYNIPINNVIRHYDVTGKLCPGIPGWNDEPIRDINGKKTGEVSTSVEWERFTERLKS